MKIPTIETVFLKRKAPQFFNRVLKRINSKYGENWIKFKSQIEITILSPAQLQKCFEEYVAKNNNMTVSLKECRERLKQRITHLVDYEIDRNQNKYSQTYQKAQDEARKSIKQSLRCKEM